jgi:hypothetical protein
MGKNASKKRSQTTTKQSNQLGAAPQAPKAGQHGQN